MLAARKRFGISLAGFVGVALAAFSVSGCAGSRACGTECAPAQTCAPCPVAETVGQCGPRPPEAKCGEAWCCVYVPPIYADQTENCQVCPAKERCVWVPPTYGTRPKLVCRRPAELTEQVRPAVWGQQQRDVLVCPERETVASVCCPPTNLAPGERQCECWMKCCHPAVWGQECERICIEPERHCVGFRPAEYECIEETYMISPGFMEKVCEPARYEPRTRNVCVQPGRWEWRRNDICVIPVELTALQVTMVDSAPDGQPAGLFKVGSQARYDMVVSSDTASATMKGLTVVFTLPAELEFVSGGGDGGVAVTGSGASARSSAFDLAGNQQVKLFVLANVKAAPAGESVVVTAEVKGASGEVMATETENSSIPSVK
jgi:hypothetical protein